MRRDLSFWLSTLGTTGRKATYRRSRTLKARGAAHAISLAGGEPLDSRKMLAVTTNFNAITGELDIVLTADNDVAGLVLNTTTNEYEVYDGVTKVDSQPAAKVLSISVTDSLGKAANQTFNIGSTLGNSGPIAATLSVSQQVETTAIYEDVKVTSTSTLAGFGIAINSPTINFDDATPLNPLFISTSKTNIGLGKTGGNGMYVIGGTDVDISTGAGAGDIEFLDDILGGEDSGTLTLAAGTGVITFAGDIGGTGEDEALLGVDISSAASVTASGKTYLDGTSINSFTDGLTIADGVNNVSFANGGLISGYGEDGAGIWFMGKSTNSTISGFTLTENTYGIYLGGGIDGEADLSGTVIDGNEIGEDEFGIYIDNVAGGLNGEDAFVIGGTVGNEIGLSGEDGIYGWSSTGVEIVNNVIVLNGLGVAGGSGIHLEGGGEYLIDGNSIGEDVPTILGNSVDGVTIDGEDGFYSYAGTVIQGNDIAANGSYGVRVVGVTLDQGEDSILIFNNSIRDNGSQPTLPLQVGGVRIDGSENIRILSNVIESNGTDVTASWSLATTVDGFAQPVYLAITPDGGRAYVANTGGVTVSVLDLATNEIVAQVPGFTRPTGVAISGNRAYVTDRRADTVTTINTDTNSVVSVTPGLNMPENLAVMPGGGKAYIANNFSSELAVFNTTTSGITTIGGFFQVKGIAFTPNGAYAYVSDDDFVNGAKVRVVDTATDTIVESIPITGAPRGLAVTPDGAHVYVVDSYGTVIVIATSTNTVAATIPGVTAGRDVAISPDGTQAFVSNYSYDKVTVIDTATNTVVGEVAGLSYPQGLAVTADGTRVVVANSSGDGDTTVGILERNVLAGNGIDIVNGSHGTIVFSNDIIQNGSDGIYVENSSTVANPVRIGDVLVLTGSSTVGDTVTVSGDQRAFIVVGQSVNLVSATDQTDVSTGTVSQGLDVVGVTYDAITDTTTLQFADGAVTGSPVALLLGNYVSGNGEDSGVGNGINVLATGAGTPGGVYGLEILGNVIVANEVDGIHLESTRSASFGDLHDIAIVGNFVGRDPLATPAADAGNGGDGIEVINGNGIAILANYISDNGRPNPSTGNDDNGIEIRSSQYVDIGEDGLGNSIMRNADAGVDVKGSQYISIVDNEIADNGDDGIDVSEGSSDVLIEANWIHANVDNGVYVRNSTRIDVTGNLIENNGDEGVYVLDSSRALVDFNIIRGNDDDGVEFYSTGGVIEGNEIYDNVLDGIRIDGSSSPSAPFGEDHFEILGNIIRNNGDDGIEIRDGNFYGDDRDGEPLQSRVAGNTIEWNDDNGVVLRNMRNVVVGGEFPSDINFINLNGNAGVYATGIAGAEVVGNEINSNDFYGVEIDNGEDLVVGIPTAEGVNTIRRNGKAGVYAYGYTQDSLVLNNEISENPIGVMITSAIGLQVGGPSFPGEDVEFGNHIFDNGEGVRATGDSFGTNVQGNLIEDNLTGATLASVRGLTFGYGEVSVPFGISFGNVVQNNNEGLRGSGDLTDTYVGGNEFIDNTKVGIALQSAKNLTVGGFGEDSPNYITGSPVGLSASGNMTGTEVVNNEFFENRVGISLSKATDMIVGGNIVDSSLQYGISVTGNNAGTLIVENTVTNTGDGPYLGSGIYLNAARNVDIIRNEVDGSSLAGLYATGNTSGTVVQGNLFTDNRIGMFLENATNAVFGGLGEDEGNTIIGGGDELAGEFRDGILVVGTSTGSSIAGTDITNASTGVWFRNAQGIDVNNTYVTGSKFFGFNASGNLTGSKFHDNVITNTVGIGGGLGHAMHLEGAKNLQVYDNVGEDSFGSGLFVTGDTSGTTVRNNLLDGNRVGISLVNATNAAIGGLDPWERNFVVGGSDAANGVYRDGIQVIGTSAGSSISGTEIGDVTTGISLENATGLTVTLTKIEGAQFLGVNAQGTLTGTSLQNTTITQTGGLGALGHGIYLANASGLSITTNRVEDSTGGGLYATGTTTGTVVRDNDFEGNRVGIYLVNATDAVIGGFGAGNDNRIVGGGDASKGDFRDGILASGTLTGSSITQTDIINAATGITLSSASGLIITSATVRESQVFGLNASGECVSAVVSSTFTLTTGGAGGGAGVLLSAARSFVIQDATISNNVIGLLATGDCTASAVRGTTWSGNTTGVINNSTGVPPLEIDPLP